MKTMKWNSLFVALFVSVSASASYVPNQLLVKYKRGVERNAQFMETFYNSAQVKQVKRFSSKHKNWEHIILAEGADLQSVAKTIRENSAVETVQPNYILKATLESSDTKPARDFSKIDLNLFLSNPLTFFQDDRPELQPKPDDVDPAVADPDLKKAYGISKIGSDKVWKKGRGSQDIVIAVIDTGVDYNHEDLSFNMWRKADDQGKDFVGWDFIHNDNLPFDDHMHGTHCSGTIGAVGGNGIGVSGVNQRVSIMAVKFLSAEGSGTTADAVKSIDYAVANGAKVLSNSWGGEADDENPLLEEAIARAEKAGVLFVAAAGNDGRDNDESPTYPAAFTGPNMLTVAATDGSDSRAFFSNYGLKTVHLGAPGVKVYSTTPGNQYGTASGTSMACPHVAGAAALLWSFKPEMTYKEVKEALLAGVDKISALDGMTVTGGRLNIAKSVEKVAGK